ncbi:MAG: hypothetical protein J6A77_13740 [Lachnospiraceae bacterium]|nr:hypothetical protein [Lachnospiraceae bacterium]
MVNRIACFLTCGYTEAGAMQYFLKKINDNYDYKQYLPNKTIKKKGDSKRISSDISGLTGEALFEKIYSILGKYRDEISKCKAVLIEDDLDGKFHGYSAEQIEEYNNRIIDKVHEKLQKEIPVFLLYASPEAESWFVADWKNGFENLYCSNGVVNDVEYNAKLFFSHHLKQYIDKNVLGEYADNIEEYGWFEGSYIKLSDKLIEAIQSGIKEHISEVKNANSEYVKQIVESRDLYYSKKLHGDRMLRNIKPDIVADKCRKYFGSTYNQILSAEL